MALGDLVVTIDTPTSQTQAGAAAGFSLPQSSQEYGSFGAPLYDVTKDGQTYADAGRIIRGTYVTDGYHLDNPLPHPGDQFGYAMAGSYVSAPFYDDGGQDSGALFYFPSDHRQYSVIRNPFPAAGAHFGVTLEFLPALRDSKVFATVEAHQGLLASGGAVYMFHNGMSAVTTILNPTPAAGDEFGRALATVDKQFLLVGAPGDDTAGQDAGAVYVYDLDGNLQYTILDPEAKAGDRFGATISASSLLAPSKVMVGAPGSDVNAFDGAGSIHVFSPSGGTLLQTLQNPVPEVGAGFGGAVGFYGRSVIVGAPFKDTSGAIDSGEVYEFDFDTGEFVRTIPNPSPAAGDLFGFVISNQGSIGAPGTDEHGQIDSGAMYPLAGAAHPHLAWDYFPQGNFAARSVAAGNWLFVNEPNLRDWNGVTGRVHQFRADTGELLHTYDTNNRGIVAALAADGNRVAFSRSSGELEVYDTTTFQLLYEITTGQSPVDVAMDSGLLFTSTIDSGSGRGIIIVRNASTGAIVRTLLDPEPTGGPTMTSFGREIAANDGLLVAKSGVRGRAYVFDSSTGSLLRTLSFPVPTQNGPTGIQVAVEGGKIVIGSPQTSNPGKVFVFDAATGNLAYSLPHPASAYTSAHYGRYLAVSGDKLLIGDTARSDESDVGKVHVFYLPTGALLETISLPTASKDFGASVSVGGNAAFIGDLGAFGPYAERGRLHKIDITLDRIHLGGFYGESNYSENDNPTAVAPYATFTNPYHESFAAGTLSAVIATAEANDRLGILDEGMGAEQVGVQNNQIFYSGTPVATFALSAEETSLTVLFGSGISDIALQAIVRHVSFVNPSENFVGGTRTVRLAIRDSGGSLVAGHDQNVDVLAIEDAPVVAVGGTHIYTEGSPPILIAEQATFGDADGTDFGRARLTATVSGAALTDKLVILHEGNGPGQIEVRGGAVYYEGTMIAFVFSYSPSVPIGRMFVELKPACTPSSVQALIRRLAFVSSGENPPPGDRTVSVSISEEGATGVPQSLIVRVIPLNDAPVLDPSYSPYFEAIKFSATNPWGRLVSKLLTSAVSDLDDNAVQGMAIVGIDDPAKGQWQFTLNGGVNWQNLVTPSEAAARLLPANAETRVRLLPANGFTGQSHITFRAWDQTTGIAGGLIDTTTNQGGSGPLSSATDTASITVTGENNAPHLNLTATPAFPTILEDATNPAGTLVSDLLGSAVSDPDLNAKKGIAVTATTNKADGTWQYKLSGQTAWSEMGVPLPSATLLLPGNAKVRFVPNANFSGLVKLWYRAWDQTAGTPGGTLPEAGNQGGSTSLSWGVENATLTVSPLNDAPVLNTALDPVLNSIPEDAPNPYGTHTYFAKPGISDADVGAAKGIAITAAGTANGHWQYTLDNGATWVEMTAEGPVSEAAALLLPINPLTRVRFLPNANFNGAVRLWYRAWDQTAGDVGGRLATGGNQGGIKSLSTAVEHAELTVTPGNDKPIVTLSGSVGYVHDSEPPVILAPNATVSDVDSTSFTQLRVRIGDGASVTNRLVIGGLFTVDGSNVKLGEEVIGTLNTGGGEGDNSDLVVTCTAPASKTVARDLIRGIGFKTVSGAAGVRKVLFSLTDAEGAMSDEGLKTVNVT